MQLTTLDYSIIGGFFLLVIGIGLWAGRTAGKSSKHYFLSNRDMPWWLLGVSMVATTFSADTPNLVTDIIRKNGVAGNWVWWAFLLTGMLTVFVYARLWRRSSVLTDLEFYEIRYSGRAATFLRAFRAIYLGVFFNVVIMAGVMLAGMKIAGILLGWSAETTLIVLSAIILAFSTIGGFKGVVVTDFVQFGLSMLGMILAAIYLIDLPEVGGLTALVNHELVVDYTSFFPDFDNRETLITLFIIPIAVQWWNVWYPGAEPGGGGYIAQRMLSAKDENHAVKATLLFNAAHYALRPWPWILIALASLIVFPQVSDIAKAFPDLDTTLLGDDLAFPAMLSFLPAGLLGLVIASLLAALMSTISTHLNWGASYIVNDFYKRFIKPDASEARLVNVGRLSTVILMLLAAFLAPYLDSAKEAFDLLLKIGAGTGLIFILRWFWWRINAWSEISAMVFPLLVIIYFKTVGTHGLKEYEQLLVMIALTTAVWVTVTLLTRPTSTEKLESFFALVRPHEVGWGPISKKLNLDTRIGANFPSELLMMALGCLMVYALLFFTGSLLYGAYINALICLAVAILSGGFLWRMNRT